MLASNRASNILLVLILAVGIAIVAMLATGVRGGPLDPPAPPGSTAGVRLPGTPISSVPYTISQPGSYYLTANLTRTVPNTNGILIEASSVVLDLNGFTLDGADLAGIGTGVFAGFSTRGVTIRNGTVTRFSVGVAVQSQALIEDIHAVANDYGVITEGSVMNGCSAIDNQFTGISATNSAVTACVASGNQVGFSVTASSLSACSAALNTHGIITGGSVVEGCTARENATGILVDGTDAHLGGSRVTNNVVRNSTSNGIYVEGWNSVIAENAVSNSGTGQPASGISVIGQRNRIEGNHVNDSSAYGIIVNGGTGNLVIHNWADANNTDYFFGAGNDAGPITVRGHIHESVGKSDPLGHSALATVVLAHEVVLG